MLTLRQVRKDDCWLLWEWANDPTVRAVSFSSELISWETHVEWFQSKLEDPHCLFFIAVDGEGTPIGQVRYDISDDNAVISISTAKEFRGKSYGSEIIRIASERVFNVSSVGTIHAHVKQGNEASTRAFTKAGFRDAETISVHGHRAVHLTLKREVYG